MAKISKKYSVTNIPGSLYQGKLPKHPSVFIKSDERLSSTLIKVENHKTYADLLTGELMAPGCFKGIRISKHLSHKRFIYLFGDLSSA